MSENTEINGGLVQTKVNGENNEHTEKSSTLNETKTLDEYIQDLNKKSGNSSGNMSQANTTNRQKKRKKTLRDATAPKQPLTGYFRFLNNRREKVRSENPTMSFADLTKLLASEWSSLPTEQKQEYLDAAEQDKERYNREFRDYKQTEAYRLFNEKQEMEKRENSGNNKKERNGTDIPNDHPIETPVENEFSGFDIPIFTEEFLDHNKSCESELRQLRKATSDYEAQNAVLQRHVDKLHSAVRSLDSEANQQRITNQSLQRHLDTLRNQFVTCFSSISLPGIYDGANIQNLDNYIEQLEAILETNADPLLKSTVRNAVSRLETMG
ncbi:high mobility group protein 20A isoform X2 [Aphidius gifuensis]|uniref:high mobility group protein 20A isoform X2 n=1 Tax=Aphidius gifuensis TaxID=684658 RepID=UPI001CDC585E|nr:high mobility group protein 20A isoform X2 [Aphidius gifuensis]